MSAPLLKRLIADPRSAVTRADTIANAAHLSPAFLDEVLARYAGTRLGRQEIDGLWSRAMIEASVPLKTVHATRGKYLRAEPVAALYAQGRVKYVAPPKQELEDQMCDFGLGGLSSGGSPDRLDALVWAVTELTAQAWKGPRIRAL
jgi:phage terminase large subunit-like protein